MEGFHRDSHICSCSKYYDCQIIGDICGIPSKDIIVNLTCSEFTIVKIQANTSELLLATNSSPNIHVPPSNGSSATILNSTILCV